MLGDNQLKFYKGFVLIPSVSSQFDQWVTLSFYGTYPRVAQAMNGSNGSRGNRA
jgi:hypothetical protein